MVASARSERGWKKSQRTVHKGLLKGQLGYLLIASLHCAVDGPRDPRQWPGQHAVPKKASHVAAVGAVAGPDARLGLSPPGPAAPSLASCCSVVQPHSTSTYCSSCLLGEIQRHSHLLPHQTLGRGKGAALVEEPPPRLGWDRLPPRGGCFPPFAKESVCLHLLPNKSRTFAQFCVCMS